MIPDPEAEKPEEWDVGTRICYNSSAYLQAITLMQDEEDGDWIAPMVPNPRCEEAAGCGPWTQPKIRNPDYKVCHSALSGILPDVSLFIYF